MSDPAEDPGSEREAVPMSEAGRGAVAAFIRVVELYDPSVAHRAAIRALVAARVSPILGFAAGEVGVLVAASALLDVDLAISRPAIPEAEPDGDRSALGANLIDQVPGLGELAQVLRARSERWDGSGSPDGLLGAHIPERARVVAAIEQLVGNPAVGFLPSWNPALARLQALSGTDFDPAIVEALRLVELESIDLPETPSASILELLAETDGAIYKPDISDPASNIARAVAAAARIDDVLDLFASSARRTIDARSVAILRMSKTSIDDEPAAHSTDERTPAIRTERFSELAEFSTHAELRAGVPLLRGVDDHTTAQAQRLRAAGVGSEVIVPIMLEEGAWGVVTAARGLGERHFDSHDLSVLRHVAHQISEALENTVRWAEIEKMALRDQLTGLSNRHVLYTVLDEIFDRDPTDRQDCALIMCDVDGLKIINDTDGHQAGDRLLIDAARALEGAILDTERTTVCRIGGDEFCLIIDGGALLTAHEISDTIERLFARSAGDGVPRSISCGIAFASIDVETRSQLLRAADENQYETKRIRRAARGEPIPVESRTDGDRRAIRD